MNKVKIYFARPITNYKTKQDERDIALLSLFGDVINPDKESLQERYKQEGMSIFEQVASECDALAFRSFPDGTIGAGVWKEILAMGEKPIIELPRLISTRVLSVDDTREYLRLLGGR